MLLRKHGPSTEGVFRKPCNSKNMKDIREQLNSGVEVDLEVQPVFLLVGLLKVCYSLCFIIFWQNSGFLWLTTSHHLVIFCCLYIYI